MTMMHCFLVVILFAALHHICISVDPLLNITAYVAVTNRNTSITQVSDSDASPDVIFNSSFTKFERNESKGTEFTNTNIASNDSVVFISPENVSSVSYEEIMQRNYVAIQRYEDKSCNRPDPYWCTSYVEGFMKWKLNLRGETQKVACKELVESVQHSDNRCCQSVRRHGC
ncbi:hypothetical protein AB6A40_007130 [Gnathostoma spinigerum]|uniref:Uncharacterized protein n=1 Tax=Gnathostoma spinigerum TaxID=75299 RepID=A0ABD6EKX5_9BILA